MDPGRFCRSINFHWTVFSIVCIWFLFRYLIRELVLKIKHLGSQFCVRIIVYDRLVCEPASPMVKSHCGDRFEGSLDFKCGFNACRGCFRFMVTYIEACVL